jgi:hypothetical protein
MLDLLRNEKPIRMTFNLIKNKTSLQAGYEPVGEEETERWP